MNLRYYCVINYVMCVGIPTEFEPLCLWMLRVSWVISPRRKSYENWQHSMPPHSTSFSRLSARGAQIPGISTRERTGDEAATFP